MNQLDRIVARDLRLKSPLFLLILGCRLAINTELGCSNQKLTQNPGLFIWIRKLVICDRFPSRCNLYSFLWFLTRLASPCSLLRNIAVSMDLMIVGKFVQTDFPGAGAEQSITLLHSKFKLSSSWTRETVINDFFPSRCNLYCLLWVLTQQPSWVFSLWL